MDILVGQLTVNQQRTMLTHTAQKQNVLFWFTMVLLKTILKLRKNTLLVTISEYVRRNRAEQMLAEQGEVIETASGAVKRNPWHEVIVNSNSSLSQLATKLRLCVNSRITAKTAGKNEEKPKPKRAGLMFGA